MAQEIVVFGLVYSLWLGVWILLSYLRDPRIWLHDYPKEMQALVPPRTDEEKRQLLWWAIPTTGSMLAFPLIFVLWRDATYDFSYFEAFATVWIIMQIFNVFDLIVLDWFLTVWWRPKFIQLEGAEVMNHHDNYHFHFAGFIRGLGFSTIGAAATALPFVWL